MSHARPQFSICIPAYNRACHLSALLDSILAQDYANFEIVICEDKSPEREQIQAIVQHYSDQHPGIFRFFLNERNLGYDANIRNLVSRASGEFCFFMGNDDLMCAHALSTAADILLRSNNVGLIVRSYAWFDQTPGTISGEVRYFTEERVFAPGPEAISLCFRRSGVISGYIVHRDSALAAATNKFDGTLYYQMHLTANVLVSRAAVFTPAIMILCRNSEPPDFGNSTSERERFTPGRYTPEARQRMVGGALEILKDLKQTRHIDLVDAVTHDYANYFYPYIRDQLNLPLGAYLRFYRNFSAMGFGRYPMFHLYMWLCYLLKQKGFDSLVRAIRQHLGRSPQFKLTT